MSATDAKSWHAFGRAVLFDRSHAVRHFGRRSGARLEGYYRDTIAPAARALAIAYFDRPPDRPISVVLVSGDEAYQSCVEKLDGQRRAAFAGYYERQRPPHGHQYRDGRRDDRPRIGPCLGPFRFPRHARVVRRRAGLAPRRGPFFTTIACGFPDCRIGENAICSPPCSKARCGRWNR